MEEMWKDIKGYEGKYQISNYGEIMSLYYRNSMTSRLLKPRVDDDGYLTIILSNHCIQRKYYVHRLVAMHFIDNNDNLPQVNHIDSNRANPIVTNLEWCTASENQTHAHRYGYKTTKGSNNGRSILTEDIVREIKRNGRNDTCKNIGIKYGVSDQTIFHIFKGLIWKEVK